MTIRMARVSIIAMLLLATIGGVASAATKITPALQKDPSDTFSCRVLNAGTKDVQSLTVSILDSAANVLVTSPMGIGAGTTGSTSTSDTVAIGYCKVEGKFSKGTVLVTFCVVQAGTSRCADSVGDPGL